MSKVIEGKLKEQLDKYLERMNEKEMKRYLKLLTQEKKRRKRKKRKS